MSRRHRQAEMLAAGKREGRRGWPSSQGRLRWLRGQSDPGAVRRQERSRHSKAMSRRHRQAEMLAAGKREGRRGMAEQSREAAVAAGSIGPGCSQEAGEEQAQQGYEPTTSAGGNAGGRQTGGQAGVAEQSREAAVAAGSIGPGCSQEAGEEQAQQGYEPTTSAGGNAGGRQTGGQAGDGRAVKGGCGGCGVDRTRVQSGGRRGAGTARL